MSVNSAPARCRASATDRRLPVAAGYVVSEALPCHGHAQRPGKGLENRFGLVVVVLAAGRDLQVAARGAAERVEEVAEHLRGDVADPLAAELRLPLEVDPPAEVEEHHRPAVVHRQGEPVSGDPGLRAQGAVDGLAQGDGYVLHRVVFVDLQIAPGLDL